MMDENDNDLSFSGQQLREIDGFGTEMGASSFYGAGYAALNPSPSSDRAGGTSFNHDYPATQNLGDIFQASPNSIVDVPNNSLPLNPIDPGTSQTTALSLSIFDDPYNSSLDGAPFEPIAPTMFGNEPTTLESNISIEHGISDLFDQGPHP